MHEQGFYQLKDLITSHPKLKFFDPSKPTRIYVAKGMGAVLLQYEKLIMLMLLNHSYQLSKTTLKYEKEMLAIVFGCYKN